MKIDTQGTQSTLAATGGKVLIERPKGVSLMLGVSNGSDLYPGCLITGADMTSPAMNLIDAAHEEVSGVAIRMVGTAAATAPDTAFTATEPIEFAGTGSGCVCYVKFTSNAGWYPGQLVMSKGDGTGQGIFGVGTGYTFDGCTSFHKHFLDIFGRGAVYQTDTSTPAGTYTYVYSLVRLSL